jgi:hypothetical protein
MKVSKTNLKLGPEGTALRWVGAWTKKMQEAGFRFDPETRRLDKNQAVKFVKTVMKPGFMHDEYNPKLLDVNANEQVHIGVTELVKDGYEFFTRAGQRAFDQISSFDLRSMVNNFYKELISKFSYEDLLDPEMKLFKGMPGVSVIGVQSFPTFKLTPIDDKNKIIYSPTGFMEGNIETTREDKYFKDNDGINKIRKANREILEADLKYAFNRIFAEHGLFGYKIEMVDFDPLTALGGMGMSNHVLFSAMTMASILTEAGKDEGQLFAESGYYENEYFNRITGFQEMIQAYFKGTGIIIYAHDYYGGIGRQLLAPGHASQIEENMRLIVYNRITGDIRRPVNDTWTMQAADKRFRNVYQSMLDIAWEKETLPLLRASALGSPIDMSIVNEGYLEHAWIRFLACEDYFGNKKEREFILQQREKGNAVFPLGEGSNNSAKLFIFGPDFTEEEFRSIFSILDRNTALKAIKEKGTVTTGEVSYKVLDKNYELGSGFYKIHDGRAVPKKLITIAVED